LPEEYGSFFSSRDAAYAEYSRLMTEGSRCNRFPSSFTLNLPHSRPKYTNIDLAVTDFRYISTAARRKADDNPHNFAAIEGRDGTLIDMRASALCRQSWNCRPDEREKKSRLLSKRAI
jgi:hypothetical protein